MPTNFNKEKHYLSQFHIFYEPLEFQARSLSKFFSIAVASEREVVVISINSHGKTQLNKDYPFCFNLQNLSAFTLGAVLID